MKFREQFLRHRKDNRWIVGGLALLLLILTAIYYFLQSSRDLPSELVTNRVLLFILWYVNLTLILAILFVLLRNLFKLAVERHYRILGSRFKTKLVATYVGLSLLPGLLLFAYGSQMLKGWINQWFDEPAIREVTSQGYDVAQGLYRQAVETRQRDTDRVLREIDEIDLENPRRRPRLDRRMRQLLTELDLDYLAVYSQTEFVHAVINPESDLADLPEPSERLLVETLRDREAQRWQNLPGDRGRLLMTARAAPDRGSAPRAVVVAGALLDPELASQSRQLIQAYQGYRQLEVGKEEIEAGYMLTFLMVTLLILLASSWTGIYLARRIMIPIQALAEATKRISEGDLDFQVSVAADDEIGVLVQSFNSMTAELQRKEELLEESNQELVSSNRRLAEERAVISAVLQNLAAGVISVDDKGRILTANGAALKMLDQPEGGLVGRPISEVWGDPERGKLAALFQDDKGGSRRVERDVRLVLGGQWRTFTAKVTTMLDERGEISGRVMVLEEMTELVRAQQMAAWSEAARRIAHEIKNPLTPIKLSAERLLKKHQQADPGLGTALEEGVEIITREVEVMKGMVDEFSRFARMPRARPTEVDVVKLVEETLGLYEGLKEGIGVSASVAPEADRAWLDPEQIKRALINLLDNAVEATTAPGDVSVSVAKSNGNLLIDVADTGPGIDPRAKDKLFLPHFSTKGRGTGLGLSIVQRIVIDHHGTIQADDNEPNGTVFRIVLPQA